MIGTHITTEAGLAQLWQHAQSAGGQSYPAVLDGIGTVWTLVKDARGNDWANAFPGPDLDRISTLRWRTLLAESPTGLIVLWHGCDLADLFRRTVSYADVLAVLQEIRKHDCGSVTAPVHQAFATASVLLEQLLGITSQPTGVPVQKGDNRG